MSADEIMRLAKSGLAEWQVGGAVEKALLDFAAIVERCEGMRSDTMNGVVNYIIRGDGYGK